MASEEVSVVLSDSGAGSGVGSCVASTAGSSETSGVTIGSGVDSAAGVSVADSENVSSGTGVSAGVATVEDIRLMKANVTEGVKLKASAGIRTYADAAALVEAGADRLGTSAGIAIAAGK